MQNVANALAVDLDAIVFAVLTDLKSVLPTGVQKLREDVPTFTVDQLEHLMPKWHKKPSGCPRRIVMMAKLSCNTSQVNIYLLVFPYKSTVPLKRNMSLQCKERKPFWR